MNTYTQLALVAAIVIYIVDVSGFTASWRSALEKALGLSHMTARKEILRIRQTILEEYAKETRK